jgi:hypothetical protein
MALKYFIAREFFIRFHLVNDIANFILSKFNNEQ